LIRTMTIPESTWLYILFPKARSWYHDQCYPCYNACYMVLIQAFFAMTFIWIVPAQISFPKEEHKILKFWEEIKAFETSLKLSEGRPRYSFYDGPPFATGLPHYGHLLAGTIKVRLHVSFLTPGAIVPTAWSIYSGHRHTLRSSNWTSRREKIRLGLSRSPCWARNRQKTRHQKPRRCYEDGY
jgi:isoleucyl-tRNA synthetase